MQKVEPRAGGDSLMGEYDLIEDPEVMMTVKTPLYDLG